jgi:hypothetical protein
MKNVSSISSIIILFFFFSCRGLSGGKGIQVENSEFIKSFICDQNKPGVIQPEYYRKTDGKILNHGDAPYFEFVINGKITTSNDKLWVFRDMKERQMINGGTEYTLEFAGVSKHVKGLGINIIQQVFPGSSLVREKLILSTSDDKFRLNKNQGKLHFTFPRYAIQTASDDELESVEIKIASWEKISRNHMYFPDIKTLPVRSGTAVHKGPIHILHSGSLSWITAYEHASQDDVNGLLDKEKIGAGNLINDAMQGTKGVFNFPLTDEDFKFLGICTDRTEDLISISVDALRGAYLDDESIDAEHPYETVWTATAFYEDKDLDKGREIIRNYLFHQICENPVSRKPEFYYNTWGMQREDRSRPLRGILTYDRIFEEIDYAAQLGVDIFVLDDGWEQTQGDWTPHAERLPDGLGPIKDKLDEYGIKMGIWFSSMGIDSTTQRYKEHPEWVILDSEGNPIRAQWDHPAFDFVSGFYDVFIGDCKRLINQGCRFMKWDAINTFYSTLPDLWHGSGDYSKEELRARYEYLLPIYVVKAMEELMVYEPELVIEIDLTEARRVMIGLAPLSQGKLFFMNNGASSYNDYSSFRTKSLRTIANEFAGLIPLELFTYASYPHDLAGCMEYNVNNSLLAGHGFWGDLSLMSGEQRDFIGQQVMQSKRVLPYIAEAEPAIIGKVGDSPEIYSIINSEKAAGQIISFSEEPSEYRFDQNLNTSELLAVLNNPYDAGDELLKMDLTYKNKESTSAIFLIPNEGTGITIVSSTASISDAHSDGKKLSYQVDGTGTQLIRWPLELGEPIVKDKGSLDISFEKTADWLLVKIQVKRDKKAQILLESNH